MLIIEKFLLRSVSENILPKMFLGKVFWKYAANLQENTQVKCAISIKLLCNFIEIALPDGYSPVISCIFSEHFFLRTPLEGNLCKSETWMASCCSFGTFKDV